MLALFTRSGNIVLWGYINKASTIYQKYVECLQKNILARD